MNLESIRRRLDDEHRYLARDGESIHVLPHLTRVVRGSQRQVMWSSLDERNADQVIAEELTNHADAPSGFEWKLFCHDLPADLPRRLERHGLMPGEPEAVMMFDLSDGPPPSTVSDCTVRRITSPADIEQYRRVAEEALGKDYAFTSGELAAALVLGSTQHLGFVGYFGAEPVSIGRLYTHPLSAFGGLYGGTTLKRFRGRGFYHAVVAARAVSAMELGARYLLVDALPTSRPILERLGFERLTDTIPFEFPRSQGLIRAASRL